MTINEARRVAALIAAYDVLHSEWLVDMLLQCSEEDKRDRPFIVFRDIAQGISNAGPNYDVSVRHGRLFLPRDIAVAMIKTAQREVRRGLVAYDVDVPI